MYGLSILSGGWSNCVLSMLKVVSVASTWMNKFVIQ